MGLWKELNKPLNEPKKPKREPKNPPNGDRQYFIGEKGKKPRRVSEKQYNDFRKKGTGR